MKSIFLVLFFVTVFSHSNYIQGITKDSFASDIVPTRTVWLLLSTSESQGPKIEIITKLANILRGIFRFGIIQPGTYPEGSLHLYGDERENPLQYTGEFQVQSILKFILKHTDQIIAERSATAKALKASQEFQRKEVERAKKEWQEEQKLRIKSDTLILNNQNWSTFLQSRDVFLINFYQSNCTQCIELNKEWETIATQLKGRIRVAKINITEKGNEALEQQLEIQTFPTIRFYAYGNKNIKEFSLFEGTKKKFAILQWVNLKLKEKIQKAEIPTLNKQNYQNLCKNSKSTCVIFFIQEQSPEIRAKIEAIALKYIKNPISVLVAKKGQQESFAKQVGVDSYPDVVMMYCNRKSFWRAQGLDFTKVDQTISQISLGNRLGFNKYKFQQEIA